jgi:hypothetical protein
LGRQGFIRILETFTLDVIDAFFGRRVFFGNAVKRLSKLNTGFYTRRRTIT